MKLGQEIERAIRSTIDAAEARIRARVYRARLRLYLGVRDKCCGQCRQEITMQMDEEILKHGERTGEWPTWKQIEGLKRLNGDGDL